MQMLCWLSKVPSETSKNIRMADEVRIQARIDLEIVFKQVNNNLHLESTATFNKHQQNGYKIARIAIIDDSDHEENAQNSYAVLQSIVDVNPRLRNIVSLNLSHCNLSNIPRSFSVLPLKYFDLSFNLLKVIPQCILIGLPDLEKLNLSHNEIRWFETEPKCIRKLIILNIEVNMFVNIPMWILEVKCSQLEKLYYNENDLTSLTRARFATTSKYKLRSLYLRNCCLMDDDFKVLKSIRTLKTLDLGNNGNKNCNGIGKLELLFEEAHFANYLEILNVSNISLCYIPENVINLKYLKHLNVSNNNLSWLPDCIVHLRFLQYLDFSCNKVVRFPNNFNNLENLEELLGPFNSLAYVPCLNLQRLRYVDLYSNEISFFELDLDHLEMADFEQNFIDTTLLSVNYTHCLSAFRSKYKNQTRLFNEKEDNYLEPNVSTRRSSSSSVSSNECMDHAEEHFNKNILSNSTNPQIDDEEQWDIIIEDKFANMSISDSEWTGQIDNKKIKKLVKRTESLHDYIYEDAD